MATTTKKAAKETERSEAIANLRKILKPGDTVYTVLRHVSSSGMSRRIDLYVIRKNEPRYLSGYAAKALGLKRSDRGGGGIVVGGCGMDMGFHLVYELSAIIFPSGYAVEHGTNNRDGGYALNHRWM